MTWDPFALLGPVAAFLAASVLVATVVLGVDLVAAVLRDRADRRASQRRTRR